MSVMPWIYTHLKKQKKKPKRGIFSYTPYTSTDFKLHPLNFIFRNLLGQSIGGVTKNCPKQYEVWNTKSNL